MLIDEYEMRSASTHMCVLMWVSNTHLLVRSTHRVVCACVAAAHACVQFRHTHTHACSLNAQARVWEQHARACVHAHDMCVCAHEKNEAAPVIVAVSRPPPRAPRTRPRHHPHPISSPSVRVPVRSRVRRSESRAMQHYPRRQQVGP